MNLKDSRESIALVETVGMLAAILSDCNQHFDSIESSLSLWLDNGANRAEFPIGDLQSLDLLRQIKGDVVAILKQLPHDVNLAEVSPKLDAAAILSVIKLDQIKQRISETINHSGAQTGGSIRLELLSPDGDLDLF